MAVRVEFDPPPRVHGLAGDPTPQAVVIDEKPGPVTRLDKAKGYYKSLIALTGSTVAFLADITPIIPEDKRHWAAGTIGLLTAAGVWLKANERWFENL